MGNVAMSIHVLVSSAVRTCRFRIDDHPRVVQASLSVEAYGDLPMRGLLFRFYRPDGVLFHEISPAQGLVSFSAGSITFGGSLAIDPVLSRMLRNVFARFARPCEQPEDVDGGAVPPRVEPALTGAIDRALVAAAVRRL